MVVGNMRGVDSRRRERHPVLPGAPGDLTTVSFRQLVAISGAMCCEEIESATRRRFPHAILGPCPWRHVTPLLKHGLLVPTGRYVVSSAGGRQRQMVITPYGEHWRAVWLAKYGS
jgi:hypothetical protein